MEPPAARARAVVLGTALGGFGALAIVIGAGQVAADASTESTTATVATTTTTTPATTTRRSAATSATPSTTQSSAAHTSTKGS